MARLNGDTGEKSKFAGHVRALRSHGRRSGLHVCELHPHSYRSSSHVCTFSRPTTRYIELEFSTKIKKCIQRACNCPELDIGGCDASTNLIIKSLFFPIFSLLPAMVKVSRIFVSLSHRAQCTFKETIPMP